MAAGPVLIVEDEIFVAFDIERILSSAGYEVAAIAADRSEALAHASGANIALVDINLRDGPTGPIVADELAEKHGVTVVYVTANPAQIERKARTAVGVVRKPFTDEAILAAVSCAVEPARADDNLPAGFTPFQREERRGPSRPPESQR
jgi:CheY-like chemotaxis protein